MGQHLAGLRLYKNAEECVRWDQSGRSSQQVRGPRRVRRCRRKTGASIGVCVWWTRRGLGTLGRDVEERSLRAVSHTVGWLVASGRDTEWYMGRGPEFEGQGSMIGVINDAAPRNGIAGSAGHTWTRQAMRQRLRLLR
jgi:hypothetical protein